MPVTDFAWPAWFGLVGGGSGQVDQLGQCLGPFQLSVNGGHIDPGGCGGQQRAVKIESAASIQRGARASAPNRRVKRLTPRHLWLRSEVDRRLPLENRIEANLLRYHIHQGQ